MAFNDAYVEYAKILISSLVKHNPWFNDDIIIMTDNLIQISDQSLAELKEIYPNILIREFEATDEIQKFITYYQPYFDNPSWFYSYLKLYLFEIDDYDKILYLDTDIIINGDIREIFKSDDDINLALDPIFLVSTRHFYLNYTGNKYFSNELLEYDEEYCNAGVLYFGNKEFRKRLKKEFIEFGLNYDFKPVSFKKTGITKVLTNGHTFEQDVLNIYLKQNKDSIKCRLLPMKYNTFVSTLPEMIKNAAIIHYIVKPNNLLKEIENWNTINSAFLQSIDIYNQYVDEKIEYERNATCIFLNNTKFTTAQMISNILQINEKFKGTDIYIYDCTGYLEQYPWFLHIAEKRGAYYEAIKDLKNINYFFVGINVQQFVKNSELELNDYLSRYVYNLLKDQYKSIKFYQAG